MWWHALQHWLGTDNASGRAYLAWSGFGSDISELLLIGGLAAFARRHNCEVRGCWRLGRHTTAAQHHVCRRHHPDDHLTADHVRRAHAAARGGGDGQES
jgi:hypothetical protein